MSATLFGDEIAEPQSRSKPITQHQLIQHYRALLEDRLELATEYDGELWKYMRDVPSHFFGDLLRVLFPETHGKDNWRYRDGKRLSPEEIGMEGD